MNTVKFCLAKSADNVADVMNVQAVRVENGLQMSLEDDIDYQCFRRKLN
jgi:hypothetical protein